MPSQATLLVVDDEELIRWSVNEHMRARGYRVLEADNGEVALAQVEEHAPDVILTDLNMPKMGGMAFLRKLRESGRDTPVIVLTAHGAVETAVEATQLGAAGYLSKPFDLREVALAVEKALETHRLASEVHYLRGRQTAHYGSIIGESAAMQKLFDVLRRLEDVEAPTVLLTGESGTGKDLIAHAIHESGPRKGGPMMEVDCAALPEQLIESELFGHERGSFTDAKQTKRGLFEVARGGTIFLDEIGEMSLGTQAKLLRALENRSFKRVGGVSAIRLDAGVIAATNRDLADEVAKGNFREDLYFRLNVIRVQIPSLRERRDDVKLLSEFFIEKFARDFRRDVRGISGEALGLLANYPWPGNVRELRNLIERIVILDPHEVIEADHLPPEVRYSRNASATGATFVLPEDGCDLEQVEKSLIQQALDRTGGNQSAAARLLGITRYALRYRIEKHGLT